MNNIEREVSVVVSPRNVTLPYGIKTFHNGIVTFPNGKREHGDMYVDHYYSTVKLIK
ncbi:hypothetical protein [Bacillus salacetis]|uniref:hypothetical protein n=1 Tax=Bacillus salacetis TaxID=2315464 RepID=UPI0014441C23|nr:hypothetical protein [Bacillus salacetis]